ncbi:MAG: hypothetical protein R3350_01310 [Saprospiraceae bacterium]|nr:hypothetical protein [Saprospiraceae bacterium]
MNKLIVFITLLIGFSPLAYAQHETLFGNARVVGGFGAPIFEYSLNNDLSRAVGGGGGVVINNFFIGGYGMGSGDFNRLFREDERLEKLDMGHGGFWLGFTIWPYKALHIYGSTRVGWGGLDIELRDNNQRFEDVDKIFIVTPEIGLELNVFRWFRIAGTVGYRWVDGISEGFSFDEEDFRGAIAGMTLRFGGFGWHR